MNVSDYNHQAAREFSRRGYTQLRLPVRCWRCGAKTLIVHKSGLCFPCRLREEIRDGVSTENLPPRIPKARVSRLRSRAHASEQARAIARAEAELRQRGTLKSD
jgi:hypothetical protein